MKQNEGMKFGEITTFETLKGGGNLEHKAGKRQAGKSASKQEIFWNLVGSRFFLPCHSDLRK